MVAIATIISSTNETSDCGWRNDDLHNYMYHQSASFKSKSHISIQYYASCQLGNKVSDIGTIPTTRLMALNNIQIVTMVQQGGAQVIVVPLLCGTKLHTHKHTHTHKIAP